MVTNQSSSFPSRPSGNSSYNRGNNNRNQSGSNNKLRKNDRIRVPEVRVVGPDGAQIGVMPTKQALEAARRVGLDLVEIAPNARPPVCRIIDFGKYMYEISKKTKDQRSSSTKMKEIKFRINIEQHDYVTKLRKSESFLNKGNKLKITLMLRGREMEHQDLAHGTIKRAIEDLVGVGVPDASARLVGRNISVTMSPLPANKRKLKFNLDDSEEFDDDSDVDEDAE